MRSSWQKRSSKPKVAQEPVQFPQGFRVAIEPARKDVARKAAGLNNGESQCVIGPLCLPTTKDSLHPNEEDTVGDLVGGAAIGGMQTGVSCGTCFLAEIAVELTEQGITVFLCPVR
jgi:hypothetical protein